LTLRSSEGTVIKNIQLPAAASPHDEAAAAGNWMFFITVPSELLDVNIHPGKAEVRVHSSLPLFESVRRAVASLVEDNHVDPVFFGGLNESNERKTSGRSMLGWDRAIEKDPADLFSRVSEPPVEYTRPGTHPLNAPGISFIGQTGSGYLLYNGDGELIILDPHAAHERILFEQLLARKGGSNQQNISFPEQIPPTLSERTIESRGSLEDAGFRFEERSGALYLFSLPEGSGPGYLSAPIEALRRWLEVLDGLGEERMADVKMPSLACKGAVKLGERISPEEASRLFEDLSVCRIPARCPHGRPTMIRLRSEELARFFGRK